MNHTMTGIKWATMMALGMGICGAAARADDSTTAPAEGGNKPKVDPGTAAVADAVKALHKEYADFQSNPVANKLRDTSNYFTNIASMKDVTDTAILAALSRSQGRGTEDAYVKWQLLSALSPALEKEEVQQVFEIYLNAPAVPRHPGMNRGYLDSKVQRLGQGGQYMTADFGQQLQTAIMQYKAAADPIVKYRDALLALLPNDDIKVAEAGLTDMYNRVSVGADIKSLMAELMPILQGCSSKPGVSAGDLRACALALRKIKALIDDATRQPYTNVQYDNNQNRLTWMPQPVIPDSMPLESEAQALLAAANNPPPAPLIQ